MSWTAVLADRISIIHKLNILHISQLELLGLSFEAIYKLAAYQLNPGVDADSNRIH